MLTCAAHQTFLFDFAATVSTGGFREASFTTVRDSVSPVDYQCAPHDRAHWTTTPSSVPWPLMISPGISTNGFGRQGDYIFWPHITVLCWTLLLAISGYLEANELVMEAFWFLQNGQPRSKPVLFATVAGHS